MASKPKTVKDNFLAENDRETIIRNRIHARFAAMLKIGPEEHDKERDFCTAARINLNDVPDFRVEFKAHVAYVPALMGRKACFYWFADPRKVPAKYRYNPETASV